MGKKCECTRFFMDCEEATFLYEQALAAYGVGREEWGKTVAIYHLWHKRRAAEIISVDNA